MTRLPFRVTLLLWLVFFITAWNGLRVWTALAWRNVLTEFSARPAGWITALSGCIWIVAGCLIIWGIWKNKTWTAKILARAAAGYTAWYWTERLVFQAPRANWPFAVLLNLILLIFIFFTTKTLSREAHERKPKNQKDE
jgi:hypothetical protein